jgi:hypothetical protein
MPSESFFYSPLVILVAVFTLSLFATFILFRFLKSTATVIKAKWRAGGAIAGFIIIFSMAFYSTDSWLQKYVFNNRRFNITGVALLDSSYYHDGITVREMPNPAHCLTNEKGMYTLTGVDFKDKDITQISLSFMREKYLSKDDTTFFAKDFTVDEKRLLITIKDAILLKKIPKGVIR